MTTPTPARRACLVDGTVRNPKTRHIGLGGDWRPTALCDKSRCRWYYSTAKEIRALPLCGHCKATARGIATALDKET